MNQFVQSLAAMMKYFKGINEPIANNLEMIHNKFLELLKKMLKFKQVSTLYSLVVFLIFEPQFSYSGVSYKNYEFFFKTILFDGREAFF